MSILVVDCIKPLRPRCSFTREVFDGATNLPGMRDWWSALPYPYWGGSFLFGFLRAEMTPAPQHAPHLPHPKPRRPQVDANFDLAVHCILVAHGVEAFVQIGQQAQAVLRHKPVGPDARP